MKRIAIFASGSGSNAENIANYFDSSDEVEVSLILSNKEDAFVLQRAENLGIAHASFTREDFYNSDKIITLLADTQIDMVVLAGFLWLVPDNLLASYPNRIVNIHPSLLPKYGGKGMYGDRVHLAVVNNKETESGITIHLVNEHYDEGQVVFQAKCEVLPSDDADALAQKIHALEYEHFPRVIAELLSK